MTRGLAGRHEDPRTARAHAVPAAMEHQTCRLPRSDNNLSLSNEPAVSSRLEATAERRVHGAKRSAAEGDTVHPKAMWLPRISASSPRADSRSPDSATTATHWSVDTRATAPNCESPTPSRCTLTCHQHRATTRPRPLRSMLNLLISSSPPFLRFHCSCLCSFPFFSLSLTLKFQSFPFLTFFYLPIYLSSPPFCPALFFITHFHSFPPPVPAPQSHTTLWGWGAGQKGTQYIF
jgi:hypothetical protein